LQPCSHCSPAAIAALRPCIPRSPASLAAQRPSAPGPDQAAQLQLREELAAARQLGLSINASRDAIGAAKGRIEAARVARAIATISSDGGGGGADGSGGGGTAEAAEAAAAAELHAGKQRYTAQAAELKQRKLHCAALQARYKAQQAVCEAEFAAWHRLMCGLHGLRPEDVARADLPTGTDTDAAGAAGAAGIEPRRWTAAAEEEAASPPPPRAIRQAWGEAEAKVGEAAPRGGGGGGGGVGSGSGGVAGSAGDRPSPQRGGGGAAAEAVVDAALLSDLEAALEYFKQEVSGCSMR
jgi:hypothetical protein